MNEPFWRCPKCGSIDLRVQALVTMKLTQEPDESSFSTEPVGDHEWDSNSWMLCNDCEHRGMAHTFEVTGQEGLVVTKDQADAATAVAGYLQVIRRAKTPPRYEEFERIYGDWLKGETASAWQLVQHIVNDGGPYENKA